MLAGILMTACGSDKNDEPDMTFGDVMKTHIYKINGNYSDFVTVHVKDGEVCAFPGVNNALEHKTIKLSDGFYTRGWSCTELARFTRWTYEEYAKLPTQPTPEEILNNLIPDAYITEVYEMPFYEWAGSPDLEKRCNELIEAGLPGCKLIYKLEE